MNLTMRMLAGSLVTALAPQASAQIAATPIELRVGNVDAKKPVKRGAANSAERIAAQFERLAGSEENALALIHALRNGDKVMLVSQADGAALPLTSTFELPTGPMGWMDVRIALVLAQDSLARAGITHPTAEELEAAFLGGEATLPQGGSIRLKGVLLMRADGMSWGRIAYITNASGKARGSTATRGFGKDKGGG